MRFFTTLLFCFPLLLIAQVVNTEKMRINQEETGVTGEIDLSFGLTRNKAGQTLRLGTGARVEWLRPKSRWLLLGGYNRTQFTNIDVPGSAPKNFANNGFGHVRYNRSLGKTVTWEAFLQSQFDEIQEVNIRSLIGTGPRFRLVEKDSLQLFFGALYMYEYEETSEMPAIVYNRHSRLSSYLSVGFQPTGYLSINHVSYFQPRLFHFTDFRISSETTLDIRLTEKLVWRTYFQFIYDEKPPLTVPRIMYMMTNGISWQF